MPDYRWICNACSEANDAGLDSCSNCGCSATASPDEIDKHLNPVAYNKKKAHESYVGKLAHFLFAPFFLVIFSINGQPLLLLALGAGVFLLIARNLRLFKYIYSNSWARNTLLGFILFSVALIILRIFLQKTQHLLMEKQNS